MIAWARRHARAFDVAFVLVLTVAILAPVKHRPDPWSTLSWGERAVLAVLFLGPLLLRWKLPRAVFGFLVVITVVTWSFGGFVGHVIVPIAGYALTVSLPRPVAIRWTAAALLALLLPLTWTWTGNGVNAALEAILEAVVWTALGCVLGMAVASQRRYFHEARERVLAAEQSREEEAARRVAEERLRISRELHDVIAHHIAVINVQSGVAGHLLRTDPETAEQALGHVRGAAQTVLAELGRVLAVLRHEPPAGEPPPPAPGLAQVPALVQSLRDQGHQVDLEIEGEPPTGSEAVELTVYRVVQEALTNVHKHAPSASATVRLDWRRPERLVVSVTNDAARPGAVAAPPGQGFGLVGMRERVAAHDGVLVTEPCADGGYLVRAQVPLDGGRS